MSDNKGTIGLLAKLWGGASAAPSTLNPEHKKIVFLIGNNAAAHNIMRHVLPALAGMGVHADIYLTRMPVSASLQKKLDVPENKRFSFYEKLPIDVIHPLLEQEKTILDGADLKASLQYSPRQVADYCQTLGITVNVAHLDDPNDPAFVKKIADDPAIVHGYNIRSMHILKQPLIDAFESKSYNGNGIKGYIANAHPGELPLLPGTHTTFWARKKRRTWMEWSLHVIDKGIDTGPMLDTCGKALSPKKTLMQSLMSMDQAVAQMLVTNTRLFFQKTPRTALPQDSHFSAALRPSKNYTYPTHDEWDEAWAEGIRPVDPDTYIEALTLEHTGYRGTELNCSRLSRRVRRALERAVSQFEAQYAKEYQAAYSKQPPVYSAPYLGAASAPAAKNAPGNGGGPNPVP